MVLSNSFGFGIEVLIRFRNILTLILWSYSFFLSFEKVKEDARVKHLLLEDLSKFPVVDIVVEVSHPNIVRDFGCLFLEKCNFFAGSPTALADPQVERGIR